MADSALTSNSRLRIYLLVEVIVVMIETKIQAWKSRTPSPIKEARTSRRGDSGLT
jgi:hypothetical protein